MVFVGHQPTPGDQLHGVHISAGRWAGAKDNLSDADRPLLVPLPGIRYDKQATRLRRAAAFAQRPSSWASTHDGRPRRRVNTVRGHYTARLAGWIVIPAG